jgi:predicted thioesterase
MPIEPGLSGEMHLVVQESDTARFSGGDSLPPVFSTPRVIGTLERTSHNTILPYLAEGQGSVGVVVNIRHLAATPIGFNIRTRAEVVEVEGRKVKFKVEAWDDFEKIAEGEHERFIIDMDKFIRRVEKKRLEHGPQGK